MWSLQRDGFKNRSRSYLVTRLSTPWPSLEPNCCVVFAQRWSLYRGALQKVVLNQRFYPKIHLHEVLAVSVFHFHFPFPVSISTVSNCPKRAQHLICCSRKFLLSYPQLLSPSDKTACFIIVLTDVKWAGAVVFITR